MSEFVEGEHTALRQVRPNSVDGVASRLVQIQVEVGQGDSGVRIVGEVARKCSAYVALDDKRATNVGQMLTLFVRVEHVPQVEWIFVGDREPAH
jgi:hypothetical protein